MAKQKKIIDINEGQVHLICIHSFDRSNPNPYAIYLVTSPVGAPLRKRILERYADFMSVLYFIKGFYLEGLNTMCYAEMVEYIRSCTI